MSYTITLPLEKLDYQSKLINLVKKFLSEKSISISEDKNNHGYSMDIDNSIFFSYSTLDEHSFYYLTYIIQKIGINYGKKLKINNKDYSYFFYDDEITYIISNEDIEYFKKSNLNFSIISEENFNYKNILLKLLFRKEIIKLKKIIEKFDSEMEKI